MNECPPERLSGGQAFESKKKSNLKYFACHAGSYGLRVYSVYILLLILTNIPVNFLATNLYEEMNIYQLLNHKHL